MFSLSHAHLRVLANLRRGEIQLGRRLLVGEGSCLEVCARWSREVIILLEAYEVKRRPSKARVWQFSSTSLLVCYRPIEDYCIYSYEAHLNIKGRIHTGVFSRKGFPKEILCLLFMLFCSYWLYICSLVNALGYTIYCSIKLKDIDIVWKLQILTWMVV